MPEIGETLREARTRRRIDIGDVEGATKIRAKYLRALENEEWDLLPGPTFVKTFLRTYAEYLGLDARLLVEEYRQRYERPFAHELTPFGAARLGQRRRRGLRALGPVLVVLVILVGLLAALYALGQWGQDDNSTVPVAPRTPRGVPQRPTRVALRLSTPRRVRVCLRDARGRRVLDNGTLRPGRTSRTFRSRRFRVNFSHGGARMRVNGKTYRAARSARAVAYDIRPQRRPRRLSAGIGRRLCA